MVCRSALRRNVQAVTSWQSSAQPSSRRGLAAVASGSFQYQLGEAAGVKTASRDLTGATTTLALVAKAGTRYQNLPGFTDGLEGFAFKSTHRRSALRINREVELIGGSYSAYHSRENLVLTAKFMRNDLPYFVELLSEVAMQTRYTAHECMEEVFPTIRMAQKALLARPKELALNSAHNLAFHRGLGTPLHPTSSAPLSKYLHEDSIADFAEAAYAKSNIAFVANGAEHSELNKWVGEFLAEAPESVPRSAPKLQSAPSRYYGGEERIAHDSGNAMVIAFPGSSSFTAGSTYKPEYAVLAALLGGQTSVKWSAGFSLLGKGASKYPGAKVVTTNHAYSDAGLLSIQISGQVGDVRSTSEEVVRVLKSVAAGEVSKEDVKKAVALAKFRALDAGQEITAGLELTGAGLIQQGKAYQMDEVAKGLDGVSGDQLKRTVKTLLEGKASVSTVGDLFVLPYAEEMGLRV